ncbi:MAG TPA: decarboxylating 6-phosphogluconate dehydrogenase [Candidatus Saccharimonadales bacterium]|nr:decarboxylating 6-phosphogluconate dehydrogenase [Candidatus Saccharimonadales bacterium]
MVGLGKMGGNMVERLVRGCEHEVVAFDQEPRTITDLRHRGVNVTAAYSLSGLVEQLETPRVVWVMVPAGAATEKTIDELADLLDPGDVIIDGGNTNWHDDTRRHAMLAERQIGYVDVGTSGGVHGLNNGYCMMVGGDDDVVELIAPILDTLAPAPNATHGPGWLHVGPAGAGHYVKMVHNGIEYGMMRAITEGFGIFEASEFDLDHAAIAHLWMRGSVVRSWLMELMAAAFEVEGNGLAGLEPVVADSGEGRWTADEAIRLRVPAQVIMASLLARFASQGGGDFASRGEAALRNQFGGHAVVRKG